jgi:hypothetical protein
MPPKLGEWVLLIFTLRTKTSCLETYIFRWMDRFDRQAHPRISPGRCSEENPMRPSTGYSAALRESTT